MCKRWRGVCADTMSAVHLDMGWASTGPCCARENPLTDAGLVSMVARFRLVHGAGLANCNRVTDVGLERLAAGCPNLNHLDLAWCTQVTDVGLEWLAAGCPNLNHLNLKGIGLLPDGLGGLLDVQQLTALLGRGSVDATR